MTNLSKRNKSALILCAVFLLLFFVVEFIFSPAVNKKKDLKRIIKTNKSNLTRMIELQQDYNISDKDIDRNKILLQKRGKNFSLFSYLDSTAKNFNIGFGLRDAMPFQLTKTWGGVGGQHPSESSGVSAESHCGVSRRKSPRSLNTEGALTV